MASRFANRLSPEAQRGYADVMDILQNHIHPQLVQLVEATLDAFYVEGRRWAMEEALQSVKDEVAQAVLKAYEAQRKQ